MGYNDDNKDYVDINSRRSSSSASRSKSGSSKSGEKSKTLTIKIISSILSFLFIIGGIASIYAYATINSFNYEDLTKPTYDADSTDPDATGEQEFDFDINDSNLLNDPYVLNVMLFGTDRYGDAGLSDTMILLSIDNRHSKIKMTSFLRDTYISIPGVCSHKLNYAYSHGGASLSIQTIEANYGIQIDRYATVNFATFKKIVDILGGVEIEVTGREIDYINAQIYENGQSEYLYADPGLVTLNGQQALWYARNRGGTYGGMTFSGDDWDRTDRQRKFLEAVIDNMRDASLSEIIQIVNSVGPMVTTNLKKTEIQSLVASAPTFLTYEVEQCSMPSEGTWSYGYNDVGSVILVNDWYQARYDLAAFIYEEQITGESTTSEPVANGY